jgi:hypothetical protein
MIYLRDDQLSAMLRPQVRQEILQNLYDPACPSEWYRGYATGLLLARNAIRTAVNPAHALQLIDAADQRVAVPPGPGPASQDLAGLKFATMNACAYAQAASNVQQIVYTLDEELPVVARCFFTNRQAGR